MDHELVEIDEDKTLPRPPEALVLKNVFRQRKAAREAIPPFSEAKTALPVPILPENPELLEMYWRAWEMAWASLKRPKMDSGFVANFIDPTINENLFMWDTAFMVQFGVYGRRAFPFINALDNFYAKQHDDGFICREINMEDGKDFFPPFDPDATGPNIIAWAEWRYYRLSGDESHLQDIFWPLIAFHRWFRRNRTWPNGLYWATGWSSAMDNQARFPKGERHHCHGTWVDASMQAAIDCAVLERIAKQFGYDEFIPELADERHKLHQKINEYFWNPENNYYQDIDAQGKFSPVKSIGAYWGLIENDIVPDDRAEPFIQHLRDKGVFNVQHRIPSVSADSPTYDPKSGDFWRGAVWSPANFFVLKGLRAYGKHVMVHDIACSHLENLSEVFLHTDTFWENYAPESAAQGNPAKPNFVGVTGLSPISILIEDLIGIWVDWPLRRVVWYRYLDTDEMYGVENYPLGPQGTMSLIGDREKIIVTTDVPFTLNIRDATLNLQVPVSVGTTEIELT